MKIFYILDGYSLIYKSYFAFMRNPMMNPEGENSSAVFGFFRTLFGFFDKYTPEYFLVALDSLTPTFRHKIYPGYKATRDKTPEDLHAQIPRIENILKAMGIGAMRAEGYEADDIIASFVKKCADEKIGCRIITGDKDLLQLVSDSAKIIRSGKDDYREIGEKEVEEEWGVKPSQILDYLALCGDSADNIPGVKGIGPKTAVSLLSEYGSIENIYENLASLRSSVKTKMEDFKEECFLSRKLAALRFDVPIANKPEDFSLSDIDYDSALPLFKKEGMNSIIKRLEKKRDLFGGISEKNGGCDEESKDEDQAALRGRYCAVTSLEELDFWLSEVKKNKIYSFDVETTGLDIVSDLPVGFSISVKSGSACYIPIRCRGESCIPEEIIKSRLREILEDPDLKLVGQNIKFDYQVLKKWGISPAGIWFDTMVASWLTDIKIASYGMDYLAEHYFGYRTIRYDDVVSKGETFDDVPLDKAAGYAAEDADITFRLYEHLIEKVKSGGYEDLFFNIEMPLVVILGDMETEGIRIDKTILEQYGLELKEKLSEIEKAVFDECGKEFNLNSTQQLQEVLFTDRKLKPVKKTKRGYSTDTSVLEILAAADIVPAMILRYRTLAKLRSTYVDALPLLTDKNSRLHTTFRQTGTATGRLSSTNPNLQNIPVRDEEGRRIRKAFIADEGKVFLSADYSQIELVILAHLSEDPELVKAFIAGTDVHRLTASLIFGIPCSSVSSEQRRIAKVINFGVMYGMSAFRLSGEIGISVPEAARFIKAYFERYAGIRSFVDKTLEYARGREYVKTILGRKRYVNGINSKNKNERSGAERIAVNSPIQGSAADIVKLAMINISRRMSEQKLGSKMVLQIHDELIFEVPKKEIEIMKDLVRDEMENVMLLKVPLRVSIETAESWGDIH